MTVLLTTRTVTTVFRASKEPSFTRDFAISGTTFPLAYETALMNNDRNEHKLPKQPEDGNDKELNASNSDATLTNQTPKQADSPGLSDNATTAGSDNLTQSVMNGSEINPEYGDAADPTFETL